MEAKNSISIFGRKKQAYIFDVRTQRPAMTLAAYSLSGNRFVDSISLMIPLSMLLSLVFSWLQSTAVY